MKVRRARLRIRVLASKEDQIMGPFLRDLDRARQSLRVITREAEPHPGEQSLKGLLAKSLNEDEQVLASLARELGQEEFLAVARDDLLPEEERTKREAEEKDSRRTQTWTEIFNGLLLSGTSTGRARAQTDQDPEVKRLTLLSERANQERARTAKRGDQLRHRFRTAYQGPEKGREYWSFFWDQVR